jgi:AbrB family looped-hinge helix DNA binding protein
MENKPMPVVKVGSKHQVVIPREVRDELGIEPGDYVEISRGKNGALIKRQELIDAPPTDERLGPKAKASLRAGLKDVADGKAGPPLRGKKEVRAYLDGLKKTK